MSNYRVRQVLALGPMPERELRVLTALSSFLNDGSVTARLRMYDLVGASGLDPLTARVAIRELVTAGKLAHEPGLNNPGRIAWTVHVLDGAPPGRETGPPDPP